MEDKNDQKKDHQNIVWSSIIRFFANPIMTSFFQYLLSILIKSSRRVLSGRRLMHQENGRRRRRRRRRRRSWSLGDFR
jgi:hypothetical protein